MTVRPPRSVVESDASDMRFSSLNRTIHYWISIVFILPLFVISVTGALLQLKKHLAWVQPTEYAATPGTPTLSLRELVAVAGSAYPAIAEWDDAVRIEIRPKRNLAKVVAADDTEVQIDLGTGRVMQVAHRRSDWLESLHDGSWFGDAVKFGWFLPTAILLVVSVLTGGILFLLPYVRRRGRESRDRARAVEATARRAASKLSGVA